MAIIDYTTLCAEVNSFATRSYTAAKLDTFIGLAEGEFRLYFGPNFAKEASTTLAFVAGSVALPSGYIRALALTNSTYGELTQSTIAEVRERRISGATGVPQIYAVTGSTIEVGPSYAGALTFDYEGTLAGLSASNATNWLILNAPQAYFWMVSAQARAYEEEWQTAASMEGKARAVLDDLGIQSMVAQLGRASVQLPGSTP